MKTFRFLFAAIMANIAAVTVCTAERIETTIDGYLVVIVRHASITSGTTIRVWVNGCNVWGFSYEFLKPEDPKELSKLFFEVSQAFHDARYAKEKISKEWFAANFEQQETIPVK